jgi:ribonuclease HI
MINIFIDGASRGNPGKSSCAFVIEKNGKIVDESSFFLGVVTNNQAEYNGLIYALERAVQLKEKSVQLFSDSELLVKQIQGFYQVKSENLKPLFQRYIILRQKFESLEINHIPREKNKRADLLCNQELNRSFS